MSSKTVEQMRKTGERLNHAVHQAHAGGVPVGLEDVLSDLRVRPRQPRLRFFLDAMAGVRHTEFSMNT